MTKTNLTTTIDALGEIKAQIAALEIKEKALKANLADLEPGAYEGELFRVSISQTDRETLDMKAVRAKLSPSSLRRTPTSPRFVPSRCRPAPARIWQHEPRPASTIPELTQTVDMGDRYGCS